MRGGGEGGMGVCAGVVWGWYGVGVCGVEGCVVAFLVGDLLWLEICCWVGVVGFGGLGGGVGEDGWDQEGWREVWWYGSFFMGARGVLGM